MMITLKRGTILRWRKRIGIICLSALLLTSASAQEQVYPCLTLDAGAFRNLEFNTRTGVVKLELDPAQEFVKQARLRIERLAKQLAGGIYHPSIASAVERNAFVIPLKPNPTVVELSAAK